MISKKIKALVLDMDGVLWTGDSPIGDLSGIFNRIYDRGLLVAFATNNSIRTPSAYIERLENFGVRNLVPDNVITSSITLADELKISFSAGGEVFVIGEEGLKAAITDAGFNVIEDNPSKDIIAVAVGIDRKINFNKLKTATLLIREGIPFYGTNPDKTFPTPEGMILGTGSLLAALITSTDVNPIIVGKPSPKMIAMARKRLGVQPSETLVIGDRLETDVASGQADGCHTALVFSGISNINDLNNWSPRTDYYADSLSDLLHNE
ncbi:HAD-IIA family hydrolase [Chloroflexota bacterium]